ncbi:MAG: exopolyphosphatase [Desulfobacterales bacterium]|nr:exopolyphosphatase [Desulfobacterales bacterium]
MRIVTRPDFDGIVCAALIYEAENITHPTKWVKPNDMQKRLVEVYDGDIIANLPHHPNASMWFDHHYSNQINTPFKGAFKIAPSAAGVVYEYYKDKFKRDYSELIRETDRIDSADLSYDEVVFPEKYPYVILSMTIVSHKHEDEPYWNDLVNLIRYQKIDEIMRNSQVTKRCDIAVYENAEYTKYLKEYTTLKNQVAITDFRSIDKKPIGNRFLVYALFPESVVQVVIARDEQKEDQLVIQAGYNIFNKNCNVNIGAMLSKFEGGGHRSAGACRFNINKADTYIPQILDILFKNKE